MLTQEATSPESAAPTMAPAIDYDVIQKELMDVLADITQAQNSRGQPGHLGQIALAEIASGRFIAQHGRTLLHLIAERQRSRAAA